MTKKVLWQLSHHSETSNDGWSGAPDEARWIREDLTPRVIDACKHYGIEIVLVDGDMVWHPEYADDYLAFCAPHYEANLHGHGGWFWGRADASATGPQDDRLGEIFERRYIALTHPTGGPPIQMAWTNPNVTQYYGFNWTSPLTPGILVEHGVGWRLPADYDYTWLREHTQDIADIWALTLLEFAGGPMPEEGDDDMSFTDEDRRKLTRVYDHLEAFEAMSWMQRMQDWLSKALKSMPPYAKPTDFSGPDVTTDKPRT